MTIDYLEKQLENWKRWLLVSSGAAITLLATSIADIPNYSNPSFPGWFAIWLILQLGTTPAGFGLLSGKGWRTLPLAERLNTAFGYLTVAWITLLAFGFKAVWLPSILWFLIFGLGIALAVAYLTLRRTRIDSPEEMFP